MQRALLLFTAVCLLALTPCTARAQATFGDIYNPTNNMVVHAGATMAAGGTTSVPSGIQFPMAAFFIYDQYNTVVSSWTIACSADQTVSWGINVTAPSTPGTYKCGIQEAGMQQGYSWNWQTSATNLKTLYVTSP